MIYSKTKKKYIKHIKIILKSFKKTRFKIKLKKSIFYSKKIDFLRYVIISKKNRNKKKENKQNFYLIKIKKLKRVLKNIRIYKILSKYNVKIYK